MHIAKSLGISMFIVGHVTKEGAIAGPRVAEHMVDCVLYFEGDRQLSFRILRAVKIVLARLTKSVYLKCVTAVSEKSKTVNDAFGGQKC